MSRVMAMTTTVVEAATAPPVDLLMARAHLRALDIAPETDDLLTESWVLAAASYFEEYTGRPIMRQTFEAWLDAFPVETRIELPHPPLVEVVSVRYVSSDGTLTDFTDGASPESPLWETKAPSGLYARRGWITPVSGQSWPVARDESGAVRIRYRAGYASSAGQVPDIIRSALLLMVGSSDRFRAGLHISEGARVESLPFGVDQMIQAFKYTALPSQVLHRW